MNTVVAFGIFGLLLKLTYGKSRNVAEYELINNVLLKNYSKQVLPSVDDKTPVTVTFDVTFRRLIDVDAKNQVIIIQLWVKQEWNNPLLRWKPEDHLGIKNINLQNDLIWVPDNCLYNMVDYSGYMPEKIDTSVKIDYTGNCTWLSPFIFKSECKIDVSFFPFDQQACYLEFGSWTYSGKYVDIVANRTKFDLSHFIENTEWHITELLVYRKVERYPCCPEAYPLLVYRFVIKRRTLFYLTNLIIPCCIIASLAFLSFCLPVECGERIALLITVLLSMTVYLLLVSSFMPPTSEVIPLVGKFNLACMIEITICLLATFLVVEWHHKRAPMPSWIRLVVNDFLASVLFVKQSNLPQEQSLLPGLASKETCVRHGYLRDMSTNGVWLDIIQSQQVVSTRKQDEAAIMMESIRSGLAIMSDKIRRDKTSDISRGQWKFAARVLDRFFFLLCLSSFLITVVIIFASASQSDEKTSKKTV